MRKMLIGTVILFFTVFLVSCKPSMMEVSFDTHGGTEVESIQVKKGYIIDLPFVEKEGHYLDGWYYDSNYQRPFDNKITNSTTIHARWQKKTYHLNFITLEDTLILNQVYDSEVWAPPVASYQDKVVYDWYDDASYTSVVTFPFQMPAEDLILYARIEDKKVVMSSLAESIFTSDRLYASSNINPMSNHLIPSTLVIFEQHGKDYLIHTMQGEDMLLNYASFRDQKIYTMNPQTQACDINLYDEDFVFDHAFYQNTLMIKDFLKDMSLFEYETYYLRLKEAHLVSFSNQYLNLNDEISHISDFRVYISYNIYSKVAIDVSFYNALSDELVSYAYTAIGLHEIYEVDLSACQMN